MITPGTLMHTPPTTVLISVVNQGAAFVDVSAQSNLARLTMAGMPRHLAKFLVNQIHRVLGD